MSTVIAGNASLSPDSPYEIVFDEYGVAGSTIYLSGNMTEAVGRVSAMVTHPDYPWLKRKMARITRIEGSMCNITVTFEGIAPTSLTGAGSSTEPKYRLSGSLMTSPIETHAKFHEFAGYWNQLSTWVHGAKFGTESTDRGQFKGFTPRPGHQEDIPWAGIKSFEEPSVIFEEIVLYPNKEKMSSSMQAIDIGPLGKINTPPNVGRFINVAESRNWLFIGVDIDQIGYGLKVVRKWRLSGRFGWNQQIYSDSQ